MSNLSNPLKMAVISAPKKVCRAYDMVALVARAYRFHRSHLPKDQSINLVCAIGGVQYDVYSANNIGEFVSVQAKADSGKELNIVCAVEQLAFMFVFSEKQSGDTPREIGFHANNEPIPKVAKG
jgi:hypothetical protein